MDDMGTRLKSFRLAFKYSQRELANKLGVTKGAISAYENNLRTPSNEILIEMSKIFRVSTDVLLGCKSNNYINVEKLNEDNKILVAQIVKALESK